MDSVIEILVLMALTHQMDGDIEKALTSLQRALDLAELEGYVRIFVDEGPPMAALPTRVTKQPQTTTTEGSNRELNRQLVETARRSRFEQTVLRSPAMLEARRPSPGVA